MKTLIKNGKIVLLTKIIKEDILIIDGKISKIGNISKINNPKLEIIDAEGKYILPGLVEVHGHMREPGMSTKEDVTCGTQAAIAGGFTTIIDMPNTKPPTTTVDLLNYKIKKVYSAKSYSDYSFFLGVTKDSLVELEKVDRRSIAGVKVFMAGHETTPTTIPDDKTLAELFSIISKRKLILAVHAEDQWLINYYNAKYKPSGRKDPALWSQIRPESVVITAAARAITLSEFFNTTLYLLHLSTPEEFALVEAAFQRGVKVYGELVGYQLFFNIDDYKIYGNKIKVSPALRAKTTQNELWELVREGKIDVICSEHTPHEWKTKNQPDVWQAQSGTPGIQETLPAFITYWLRRYGVKSIDECLKKIALFFAYNPAKIFGFTQKGSIELGKDADLVLIDIYSKWQVKKKDLFSKCGWSVYEGTFLRGRPIATYLRGKLVYKEGQMLGIPQGKHLIRSMKND